MSDKAKNSFPHGWDQDKVLDLLSYYENQTEDAAVAEDEAFAHSMPQTSLDLDSKTATLPWFKDLTNNHK